ncbi:spore germination protein [Ectobacillus funiculus]|uniref:GerAB/ArcD/ProY family transporter n=1 Tax=Ectobacillus funiculus TaxID=137993 RepID=UPI00397C52A7
MEKAKISAWQLFCIIVLFELGTSLVVSVGIGAKQDAWLAILVSLGGGLALFLMYGYLFRLFPTIPLTSYIQKIVGTYIGWPLGLLYMLYFIYTASRILRDGGILLVNSAYNATPIFVINFVIIITIAYVVYHGIEVLARTVEIMMILFIVLGILGNASVLFSGIMDVKNLLPVLENGWKPVLQTAFPLTFAFPGEMVCFTMLLPYLNKPKLVTRIGIVGMLISSIILSYTIALNVTVLGVDMTSRATFPLLTTVGKVDVAGILERVDIIVILTLVIGVFFKIAVYFYSATIGIADLFKIENHRKFILPVGILILNSSMIIASNTSEHLKEGLKVVPFYEAAPFQLYIPLTLLIVAFIRKKFNPQYLSK